MPTSCRCPGYPNGQSTSYSYFNSYGSFTSTGDENLKEIKNLNPSTAVLSQNDYTDDATGKIVTWKQQADSNTPTLWTNGYDAVDQLTSAVKTNTSTEATIATTSDAYDFAGNRTQELTTAGVQTASAYNNLNQLVRGGSGVSTTFSGSINKSVTLTVNGQPTTLDGSNHFSLSLFLPGGTNNVPIIATDSLGNQTTNKYQVATSGSTVNPTYDADGNELTDENGNNYRWDAKSELTAIIYNSGSNSGNHTEFTYDAMGDRIAVVERTGTTIGSGTVTSTRQLVWDGSAPVEERNVSNTVTRRFYSQGEQISGTNYYYTRDHLHSVREMTDSSGNLVTRLDYDPVGRMTVISGTILPDFQYAGMYEHVTSGLNLTMFRAYDPNTARWLSRDPLSGAEFSQGTNLYAYCQNNYLNASDPNGQFVQILIGAAIGGVVGGLISEANGGSFWSGAAAGAVGGAVVAATFNPALGLAAAAGIEGLTGAAVAGAASGVAGSVAKDLTSDVLGNTVPLGTMAEDATMEGTLGLALGPLAALADATPIGTPAGNLANVGTYAMTVVDSALGSVPNTLSGCHGNH